MAKVKGLKDKHKNLVGKPFRKDMLHKWDEKNFLEFFSLVYFFAPKDKWEFNDVSINAFCQQASKRPFWEEFMWRYKIRPDENIKAVGNRFFGFLPLVGQYLQSNPHRLTPKMREMMKQHEKLEQYTESFSVKETEMGDIVEAAPNLKLPEVQYHEALLKLSAIANDLMRGITFEDIKKLPPDERIKLMISIVKTMNTVQGGQKANLNIFKQIIINQASKEDLERAMIEAANS